MKKLLCVALCVVLTLCLFTGCSSNDPTETAYREIWGKCPEDAIAAYGLDFEAAQVDGFQNYIFQNVEFYGEECELKFFFMPLTSDDDVYLLNQLYYTFADEASMQKAIKRLKKSDAYIEIEGSDGFYTVDVLSKADRDWVEKYTNFVCGESGVAMADVTLEDDAVYKLSTHGDEFPLVQVSQILDQPILCVHSGVYYYLNAKGKTEQLAPNGVAVWE